MINKVLLSSAAFVLALGSVAHASTITEVYNLNTSSAFGNVQAGTITLVQDSTKLNEVDVTVALASDFSFRISNGNHTAFAFNLGPTGLGTITATNVTTGFALQGGGTVGSYPNSPYGPDQYAFQCSSPTCASGPTKGGSQDIKTLSFNLFAAGLTDASFTDFAADLIDFNVDGKGGTATGSITAGGTPQITTTSVVPEPSSLVLFGSGLIGAAGMARRRFLKA